MKDRSGRALGHRRGDPGRPVLGDDHPPDPAGVRSADKGSQVSGVFNPIEDQEKRITLIPLEDFFKISIVKLIDETRYPLMGGVLGQGVQLRTFHLFHGDTFRFRYTNNPL